MKKINFLLSFITIVVMTHLSYSQSPACSAPSSAILELGGVSTGTTLTVAIKDVLTNDADGYAIFIKEENTSFSSPINGTSPVGDTSWNDAGQQAIYFETAGTTEFSLTVTELSPETTYYFKVYPYNMCTEIVYNNASTIFSTETTKNVLTVTANADQNKIYGAEDPTFSHTITGFLNGDEETDLDTQISIGRNAGQDVGNYELSLTTGEDANYLVRFVSDQFSVTRAPLTVTANTSQSKIYGAGEPTFTYTITGFVNEDIEADLDTPVSIERDAGETTGNYTITPAAAADSNYTVSFESAQFNITPAPLTVIADAGQSKVYGADDPMFTYTITGFVNGDVKIDLDTQVSIGRDAGQDVGNYALTQLAAGDANYTVSFESAQFDITPAPLTVTADLNQSKVYGSDDPDLTYTFTGFVNGDEKTDLDTQASIERAEGKLVGNYTLTPSAAADTNYTVIFVTNEFSITRAPLTVTADLDQSKVYGEVDPTFTYTVAGFKYSDTEANLEVAVGIERAAGEDVDDYTIIPSSAEDTNYTVSFVTANFSIEAKGLTVVELEGVDKEYDGTTAASASETATLSGLETGDTVSLTGSPEFTFASADTGSGITITTMGYSLSGADSGNYNLTQPTLSANITAKGLTVIGFEGVDKEYDGTTAASASETATLSGAETGDIVSLTGSPVFTFASADVEAGIAITTAGYVLSGADSGNYSLTQPTLSANITAKGLTVVGLEGVDKEYDGTTAASASETAALSGVETGDTVSLTGSPEFTFATKNVGTEIAITTTGYTLSGADSGNYSLSQPILPADITAKGLTVTGLEGVNKEYDGTAAASANETAILSVLQGTDQVILTGPAVFSFSETNVGTGITITTTGFTLSGADSGNYSLTQPTLSADITAKDLTVTAKVGQKIYGTTDPSLTYSIKGFVNGDKGSDLDQKVSISRSVGETVGAYTITPSEAASSNYIVSFETAEFSITPASLTIIGLTGNNKGYDGTTAASASGTPSLSNLKSDDLVSLSGTPVFTFATKEVGTDIAITTEGYEISGADSLNYTLTQPNLKGDITGVLGLEDLSLKDLVKIYPNPVINVLHIQSNEINVEQVTVYNILGKSIINTKLNLENIDTSTLRSGVYLLKIKTAKGILVRRIIKK